MIHYNAIDRSLVYPAQLEPINPPTIVLFLSAHLCISQKHEEMRWHWDFPSVPFLCILHLGQVNALLLNAQPSADRDIHEGAST